MATNDDLSYDIEHEESAEDPSPLFVVQRFAQLFTESDAEKTGTLTRTEWDDVVAQLFQFMTEEQASNLYGRLIVDYPSENSTEFQYKNMVAAMEAFAEENANLDAPLFIEKLFDVMFQLGDDEEEEYYYDEEGRRFSTHGMQEALNNRNAIIRELEDWRTQVGQPAVDEVKDLKAFIDLQTEKHEGQVAELESTVRSLERQKDLMEKEAAHLAEKLEFADHENEELHKKLNSGNDFDDALVDEEDGATRSIIDRLRRELINTRDERDRLRKLNVDLKADKLDLEERNKYLELEISDYKAQCQFAQERAQDAERISNRFVQNQKQRSDALMKKNAELQSKIHELETKNWRLNFGTTLEEDLGGHSESSIKIRPAYGPSRSMNGTQSLNAPNLRHIQGRSSISSNHSFNLDIPRKSNNMRRMSIASVSKFVGVRPISAKSSLSNLPEKLPTIPQRPTRGPKPSRSERDLPVMSPLSNDFNDRFGSVYGDEDSTATTSSERETTEDREIGFRNQSRSIDSVPPLPMPSDVNILRVIFLQTATNGYLDQDCARKFLENIFGMDHPEHSNILENATNSFIEEAGKGTGKVYYDMFMKHLRERNAVDVFARAYKHNLQKKLSSLIDSTLRAVDSNNQGWLTKDQIQFVAAKSSEFNMEQHRLRDIFEEMVTPTKNRASINLLREKILSEAFPNALNKLVGIALLHVPTRADAPMDMRERTSTERSKPGKVEAVMPEELSKTLKDLTATVERQSKQIDRLMEGLSGVGTLKEDLADELEGILDAVSKQPSDDVDEVVGNMIAEIEGHLNTVIESLPSKTQREVKDKNMAAMAKLREGMSQISAKMAERNLGAGGNDVDMDEIAGIVAQAVNAEMEEAKEEIRDMITSQTNHDDFIHLDSTMSRFIDKGEQEIHQLVNEEFIEFSDNFDGRDDDMALLLEIRHNVEHHIDDFIRSLRVANSVKGIQSDAEMLTKQIEADIRRLDDLEIPREDSDELLQGIVEKCMKVAEKCRDELKEKEMIQKLDDIHQEVDKVAQTDATITALLNPEVAADKMVEKLAEDVRKVLTKADTDHDAVEDVCKKVTDGFSDMTKKMHEDPNVDTNAILEPIVQSIRGRVAGDEKAEEAVEEVAEMLHKAADKAQNVMSRVHSFHTPSLRISPRLLNEDSPITSPLPLGPDSELKDSFIEQVRELETSLRGHGDSIRDSVADKQDEMQHGLEEHLEDFQNFKNEMLMRIESLPTQADLTAIFNRIDDMESVIDGIVIPEPKDPDLSELIRRIDELQETIDTMEMPGKLGNIDLSEVLNRIAALQNSVDGIRIPEHKVAPPAPANDMISHQLTTILQRMEGYQDNYSTISIGDENPPPFNESTALMQQVLSNTEKLLSEQSEPALMMSTNLEDIIANTEKILAQQKLPRQESGEMQDMITSIHERIGEIQHNPLSPLMSQILDNTQELLSREGESEPKAAIDPQFGADLERILSALSDLQEQRKASDMEMVQNFDEIQTAISKLKTEKPTSDSSSFIAKILDNTEKLLLPKPLPKPETPQILSDLMKMLMGVNGRVEELHEDMLNSDKYHASAPQPEISPDIQQLTHLMKIMNDRIQDVRNKVGTSDRRILVGPDTMPTIGDSSEEISRVPVASDEITRKLDEILSLLESEWSPRVKKEFFAEAEAQDLTEPSVDVSTVVHDLGDILEQKLNHLITQLEAPSFLDSVRMLEEMRELLESKLSDIEGGSATINSRDILKEMGDLLDVKLQNLNEKRKSVRFSDRVHYQDAPRPPPPPSTAIANSLDTILAYERLILSHLNIDSLFYLVNHNIQKHFDETFERIRDRIHPEEERTADVIDDVENRLSEEISSTIKSLQENLSLKRYNISEIYPKLVRKLDNEFSRLVDLGVTDVERHRLAVTRLAHKELKKVESVANEHQKNVNNSELYYLKKELAEIKALARIRVKEVMPSMEEIIEKDNTMRKEMMSYLHDLNMKMKQSNIDMRETYEYMSGLLMDKSEEITSDLRHAVHSNSTEIDLDGYRRFVETLFVPLTHRRDVPMTLRDQVKEQMTRTWLTYLTTTEQAFKGIRDYRNDHKLTQLVESLATEVQNLKLAMSTTHTTTSTRHTLPHPSTEGLRDCIQYEVGKISNQQKDLYQEFHKLSSLMNKIIRRNQTSTLVDHQASDHQIDVIQRMITDLRSAVGANSHTQQLEVTLTKQLERLRRDIESKINSFILESKQHEQAETRLYHTPYGAPREPDGPYEVARSEHDDVLSEDIPPPPNTFPPEATFPSHTPERQLRSSAAKRRRHDGATGVIPESDYEHTSKKTLKKRLNEHIRRISHLINRKGWTETLDAQTDEVNKWWCELHAPIQSVYNLAVVYQSEYKRCHDVIYVISDSWKKLRSLGIHGGVRNKLKTSIIVSLSRLHRSKTFFDPEGLVTYMWRLVLRVSCSESAAISDSVLYTWLKHAYEANVDILNKAKDADDDTLESPDIVDPRIQGGATKLEILYKRSAKWIDSKDEEGKPVECATQ